MITGAYPFRGGNTMAVLMAHLEQPVPRFAEVAPGVEVSEELEELVRRCLAKDRADRWPGVDPLREALATVLGLPAGAWRTDAITATPALAAATRVLDTPRPAPQPPRQVRWSYVIAAVVVLALALAFAGTAVGFRIGQHASVATPKPASAAVVVPEALAPAPSTPEAAPPEVEAAAPAKAPPPAPSAPKASPAPRASAPPSTPKAPQPAPPPAAAPEKPARHAAPRGYEGLPDDF
jgi:hypothetical protein